MPKAEVDEGASYLLPTNDTGSSLNGVAKGLEKGGALEQGAYGAKTIGYWSSCCLNLNNVMGAAIVALPLVNQQAGWFTPTLCILFVFVISSFASTMLVEAMQRVPGNHALTERWEFCALVGHYCGAQAQTVTSVLYNISLQSTNVAAMIVSAQILDVFIIYVAGHSVALDYHEWPPHFIRSEPSLTDPWLTQWVISAGFVVSAIIAVPLGYINLEDNMKFQWASLVGLIIFTSEFFVQFTLNLVPGTRWDNEDPTWGPDKVPAFKWSGQYQVLGMAIFAYAYVTTIPSWANEKVPSVSINSSVWWPAVVGTLMKLFAGIFGSFAFRLVREDGTAKEGMDNILNRLVESDMPALTIYSAYFWNISTLIPGIPVLAIMVRYNLMNSGIVGPKMAFFWGVVAPWLVTMFCYQASMLVSICNWSALLTIGVVNLIVPIGLYREALFRYGGDRDAALRSRFPSSTRKLLEEEEKGELDAPILTTEGSNSGPINAGTAEDGDFDRVQAVPDWLANRFPGGAVGFAEMMMLTVTFCSVAIIVLNIYSSIAGLGVGSNGSPDDGSHAGLLDELP